MIIRRFADFAAGLSSADLPDSTMHAAKRAVIDWFSSTLRGGLEPPATLLAKAFPDSNGPHGPHKALIYPSGRGADAPTAALINGAAGHTIEFDDIYRDGLYHPAAPVIPAVLAVVQARNLSGDAFLRAVTAGYEVSNRMAVAVNPAHYDFWHTTGTIGTFGAAAGASVALGLDGEGVGHAMANAGTLASGLQQAFRADAMAKPMHTAHAAQTGVILALAAEQGVTGVMDILEGERGFGAAMCTNDKNPSGPDWQAAADALETSFTIERMTFKNHAACGHTHAAIDGVLTIRNEHRLKPDDIGALRIASFQKAVEICGNADPQTIFEAKFSMPYCAAIAMTAGRVRMDAFSEDLLKDQDLRVLMDKVEFTVDEQLTKEFPKRRAAHVAIETTGGETFEHYSPTRKGDPDNPLSDDELADKFIELTEPALGGDGAAILLDALWRLDSARDLVSLPIHAAGAAAQ
ncbi:MAG: MmgE/PrpD family protein [Rhodospirillales bacterium]|nr:MmgE/PrpD family protein [Alphaproteobacteria bacterium]MBL6947320.1 MmgE/PrpD family protein [Rhodospirillales bacterium]